MRGGKSILLITSTLLLGLVALCACHSFSVSRATEALGNELSSATIDFRCENMARADGLNLLHRKLAEKIHSSTVLLVSDFVAVRSNDGTPAYEQLGPPKGGPRVTVDIK